MKSGTIFGGIFMFLCGRWLPLYDWNVKEILLSIFLACLIWLIFGWMVRDK